MRILLFLFLSALLMNVVACQAIKKHEDKATLEDNERLDNLISENRDTIHSCYYDEKNQNPKTMGKGELVVKMDRRADGSFYNIRMLEGFAGADPVFECISKNLGTWKIERFFNRGPVELTWAFQ